MRVELPDGTTTFLVGHHRPPRRRKVRHRPPAPWTTLAAENTRLATAMVSLLLRHPRWQDAVLRVGFDECVGQALLIIVECAQRFRPEKGFKFSTFACNSIRLHLQGFLTTRHGPIRVPAYAPPGAADACQAIQLPDVEEPGNFLPPATETSALEQAHDQVTAAIRRLPGRWRRLAWLRHVEGLSTHQIGRRFGVTGTAISQRLQWIDARLAEVLREMRD
jgi:RNA polymerase sigma factor (sigma-70 family)